MNMKICSLILNLAGNRVGIGYRSYITVKPRLFEVPGTAGILSNNR